MAGETELERLVVRLIGDGSSFSKMMTNAVGVTQKATTQMITALNRVEGFANTLLGAFGSLGVASSLKGAFEQFAKMERGQIRLNSIIETNGGNVQELTTRYKAVAEAISAVTLNTKGEILALFQQAEAQQFSGDAAENVVRNSIALAGATGQSAESMIRVAAMMQRGHPEFAKRTLGLRGVADGSALVDAIQRRMAGGMALAQAEFNSASGRMERLGRSLKSVGTEVGGLIAGALLPLVDFVQRAAEQFKLLDPAIKNTTYKVVGMVLAWMGLGPVTSVLRGLLGPMIGLVKFLTITLPLTILNTAAWIAWKTIVVAFGIAASVVTGLIAVLDAVAVGLVTAITGAASAFGLFMGIIGVGAFVAVVASWRVFTGILSEVADLATAVGTGFQMISTLTAPLDHITELFSGWVEILKEVYVAAQTDLPAAWSLLSAGFNLAVEQVKNLWPPLWNYVKEGFGIVIRYLSDQLDLVFGGIAQRARILVSTLPGSTDQDRQLRELERSQRATRNSLTSRAQNALGDLQFEAPGRTSEGPTEAEDALDQARQAVADIAARAAPAAERAGAVLGGALKKGMSSELKKFDAALFGTAEALARIDDYIDLYHGLKPRQGSGTGIAPTTSIPLGGGGGGGNDITDDILVQIRDTLTDISNRDENVFTPAGFA